MEWVKGIVRIAVKGEISGPFMIHDSVEENRHNRPFVLAHSSAGWLIISGVSRSALKAVANAINDLDWKFRDACDIPKETDAAVRERWGMLRKLADDEHNFDFGTAHAEGGAEPSTPEAK